MRCVRRDDSWETNRHPWHTLSDTMSHRATTDRQYTPTYSLLLKYTQARDNHEHTRVSNNYKEENGAGHLKARSPAPFQSNRLFSVFHLLFLKSFLTFKQNYLTAKVPFSISFLDSHALVPSFSLSSWYLKVTPSLYFFFPSHLCKVTPSPLPCHYFTD